MGNVVKTLMKRASKPIREFNLESRVEKIISQEKPLPAPRHPGTENLLNNGDTPEMRESLFEADSELLMRLEQVYVTSYDPKGGQRNNTSGSSRPMPTSRSYIAESLYGYHEPQVIPYGKTTLKHALQFIANHQQSPDEWHAKRIAEEYKLDIYRTEKLLKYFSTFTLVVPPPKDSETKPYRVTDTKNLGAHTVIHLPTPVPTEDDGKSS